MKTKIENTNFWVEYKLEKTLSKTLNYYDEKSLFSALTFSQAEKINKILELEKKFQTDNKSSGYLYLPRLLEKEPSNGTPNLDKVIKFFIEDLYPAIANLQKELSVDKRDIKVKKSQNSSDDLQNVFWNINYSLNRFKKGKKFLDDAHNKKIKLEISGGNFEVESYVKGMTGYVCGNGQTFIAGDGTYGHIANAKLYESLELARKKQPGQGVFQIEIKLVSPCLNKKVSIDEKIKTAITKNQIEGSLPLKEEIKRIPPKI